MYRKFSSFCSPLCLINKNNATEKKKKVITRHVSRMSQKATSKRFYFIPAPLFDV